MDNVVNLVEPKAEAPVFEYFINTVSGEPLTAVGILTYNELFAAIVDEEGRTKLLVPFNQVDHLSRGQKVAGDLN